LPTDFAVRVLFRMNDGIRVTSQNLTKKVVDRKTLKRSNQVFARQGSFHNSPTGCNAEFARAKQERDNRAILAWTTQVNVGLGDVTKKCNTYTKRKKVYSPFFLFNRYLEKSVTMTVCI
jgi:hypothetical protein